MHFYIFEIDISSFFDDNKNTFRNDFFIFLPVIFRLKTSVSGEITQRVSAE